MEEALNLPIPCIVDHFLDRSATFDRHNTSELTERRHPHTTVVSRPVLMRCILHEFRALGHLRELWQILCSIEAGIDPSFRHRHHNRQAQRGFAFESGSLVLHLRLSDSPGAEYKARESR